MTVVNFEQRRIDCNTHSHLDHLALGVKQLREWPSITAINNLRLCLDDFERDIKAGDAATGQRLSTK